MKGLMSNWYLPIRTCDSLKLHYNKLWRTIWIIGLLIKTFCWRIYCEVIWRQPSKVLTPCISYKVCSSLFQVIIAGSWVFALIFNIPLFLVMDFRKKKNRTYCGEIFPERWMAMAYSLAWLFLIVLSLVIMVVLYSRVVYTLWFKHDDENQLTCQQRVSVSWKIWFNLVKHF